jgi:hypothetical protein
MMHRLLLANGGELVEQALAGSAQTDGPLDADRLRAWVAGVGRQPDLAGLTGVLQLVNMGVLADLAARCGPVPARPLRLGRETTIDEWTCTRAGAAALARARGTELAEDVVVALPRGCTTVELHTAVSSALDAGVYTICDGRLGPRITSPAWAQFLLQVDGRRSVAQIVAAARLNGTRTWRLVQSALEDGSLVEVDAEAEIAPSAQTATPSAVAAD